MRTPAQKIALKFTEHPKENGMSYLTHFRFAFLLSARFVMAGLWVFVHAMFPFWRQSDASEAAKQLNAELNRN